jgi:hypothetical protein
MRRRDRLVDAGIARSPIAVAAAERLERSAATARRVESIGDPGDSWGAWPGKRRFCGGRAGAFRSSPGVRRTMRPGQHRAGRQARALARAKSVWPWRAECTGLSRGYVPPQFVRRAAVALTGRLPVVASLTCWHGRWDRARAGACAGGRRRRHGVGDRHCRWDGVGAAPGAELARRPLVHQ